MKCLLGCLLLYTFCVLGESATYELLDEPISTEFLACGATTKLQCNFSTSVSVLYWRIDADDAVSTSKIAASCSSNNCNKNPSYSPRFSFSVNSTASTSVLTISKTEFSENYTQFYCDDGKSLYFARPVLAVPLENEVIYTVTKINSTTTLTVRTNCLYPVEDITFKWHSITADGKETELDVQAKMISASILCTNSSACVIGNASAYYESIYTTETIASIAGRKKRSITSQQNETFVVDITYDGRTIRYSVGTFPAKVGNTVVSDGRLPLPCYVYTIILSVFSIVSLIISQARRWKCAHIVVFVILLLPHVVVTVLASVCNDGSCIDRCLPCWTHCLLLTVILFVAVPITAVLNSSQIFTPSLSRRYVILLGVFITIGAFTAVILSSVFCKAKANPDYNNTSIMQEKRTEQRWVYGLILGVMWLISDVVALVLALRPNARKGLWKRWEKVYIICNNVCITFGVVSVILSGYFTDYIDDGKLGIKHWGIYLLVTGCIQGLYIIVVIIPVLREPVHELEVTKTSMKVQLQWKCRWGKFKTFFYKLENKAEKQDPVEATCSTTTNKYDLLQCTVDKLKLDTDYTVCIYSKIWKIPCQTKQLKFKTKVPPKPENFRIKKTDTSVTLNWKKPSGTETAPTYEVVYGRTDWPNERKSVDILDKTTCTIEGLMPETNYTIKLYAIYSSGKSDALVKEVLTKASKPNPPSNFRYIKIGRDYVILQWSPCQEIKKQKFRLTYFSTETKDKKWIEYDGSERIEYTVKGLQPETEYMFDLATKVGKKTSDSSPVLVITTEGIQKTLEVEYKDSPEMANTVGGRLPDTEYRFTLAATIGKTNSDNSTELLIKPKGRVRRPAKIADLSSISTGETT